MPLRVCENWELKLFDDYEPSVRPRGVSRKNITFAIPTVTFRALRGETRATLLLPKHAAPRLKWAQEYLNFTKEDWEGVVCGAIERSKDPPDDLGIPVYPGREISTGVRRTIHQRPRHQAHDLGVLLGLQQGHHGTPHRQVSQLSGLCQPPRELPAPSPGEGRKHHQRPPVFMQDNAPIHRARTVMDWFEENNVEVMEWPPYSPDLNPIEHVWRKVKEGLQDRYLEIATMLGGSAAIRQRLVEVLPLAWGVSDHGRVLGVAVEVDAPEGGCGGRCRRMVHKVLRFVLFGVSYKFKGTLYSMWTTPHDSIEWL